MENIDISNCIEKYVEIVFSLDSVEDERVLDRLLAIGFSHDVASSVIIFCPMAFCCAYLEFNSVDFPQTYIMKDGSSGAEKELPLGEEESFILSLYKGKSLIEKGVKPQLYFKVLGRSAEMKAIDSILNSNEGAKLEDIVLDSPVVNYG